MLLSSPSFSNFLDHLSSNPQAEPQQSQQVPIKAEPQPQQQQAHKDANPYAAPQAQQQQQIGMAMIPEQTMDFSMLNLSNNDAFNFQPQVFAVLETPEVPTSINADILSGKSSNFVGEALEDDDDKLELPALDTPKALAPEVSTLETETPVVYDDDLENDPEFALYHSDPVIDSTPASDTEMPSDADIFGGLEPEKVLARYDLVDASQAESDALVAMARVQRISAALDHIHDRLERLCL